MSAGPPGPEQPESGRYDPAGERPYGPPPGAVLSRAAGPAGGPASTAPADAPAPPSAATTAPPAGHVLGAPARPEPLAGERAVRQRRQAAAPTGLGAASGRAASASRVAMPAQAGYRSSRRPSIGAALRAARQSLPGLPPSGFVRRRARAIGLGRLLTWELAGATLIASIGRPRTVAIAAIAAVACAVAATTIRIRGRLLYQWLARAGRYLLRTHQTQLAPGEHAAEDLVGQLADRPSVETIDLDGIPVAFIHQSDGIATVLELQIPDPDGDAAWAARTSVASLLPSPDPNAPPFAAKLIMQTSSRLASTARSPDASRRVWITVQVLRTADIHAEADLSLALANAVQRLIRRLAREDVPTRTFDREETLSLVSALAHLDNSDSSEPLRLGERWAAWQAGGAVHACFGVRHWHDVDEAVRLQILRRLHLIPSRGTTIAIAARRSDWRTSGSDAGPVVVRITESDRARLENSASLLAFAFDDLPEDIGLERLDGDQAGAVAGSLPLNAKAAGH